VSGSFDLLEQLADVVEARARAECAHIARLDAKRLSGDDGLSCVQAEPEIVVDDVLEGSATSSRFVFELGRDVIVER